MIGRSVVPRRGPDTHNDVVVPNEGGTPEKNASAEGLGEYPAALEDTSIAKDQFVLVV